MFSIFAYDGSSYLQVSKYPVDVCLCFICILISTPRILSNEMSSFQLKVLFLYLTVQSITPCVLKMLCCENHRCAYFNLHYMSKEVASLFCTDVTNGAILLFV